MKSEKSADLQATDATGIREGAGDVNAAPELAAAMRWVREHALAAVPWSVDGESGESVARGLDAILADQGTDLAARMTAILVCSDPRPTPAEMLTLCDEPLAAVVDELLADCGKLMALSIGASAGPTGHATGGAATQPAATQSAATQAAAKAAAAGPVAQSLAPANLAARHPAARDGAARQHAAPGQTAPKPATANPAGALPATATPAAPMTTVPTSAVPSPAAPNAGNQAETLRRMTMAMAGDIRVIMVRLAAGLHGLRQSVRRREEGSATAAGLAAEALTLLAPLANRLGLFNLKWEIEDLAFRLTDPQSYRTLARGLEIRRAEREGAVAAARDDLAARLARAGIAAKVYGRPKHLFSIHQKMQHKQLALEQLHDLRGLRVLVETLGDCYAVLDVVHQRWRQVPEEFDDYISRPKPNGYQSLHTVVRADDGQTLEVQIRTRLMHEQAEYGVAAHWRYKEAGTPGAGASRPAVLGVADPNGDRLSWLRQLLAWQQDLGLQLGQAGASTRDDRRIFVLTPQGRVIELPAGATPVDFAYHVHSTLGHRCRGAKVDGRLVPLNTPLSNGQVVDIVTVRRGAPAGPSRDWLNPNLGFVRSNRARAKVRQWFNALERETEIETGRERVEKAMSREGRTALGFDQLASRLGQPDADELFIAVSRELIGPRALEEAIRRIEPAPGAAPMAVPAASGGDATTQAPAVARPAQRQDHGVLVVGVDFLMTQLARCCHPAPPDPIIGFVTRGKGVSVHRAGCSAIRAMTGSSPERVLPVSWGDWRPPGRGKRAAAVERRYPVAVQINARDRSGLLRDISEVFAREKHNVLSVRSQTRAERARFTVVVDVPGADALEQVLGQLRGVVGVESCVRL